MHLQINKLYEIKRKISKSSDLDNGPITECEATEINPSSFMAISFLTEISWLSIIIFNLP